MYTKEKQKNIKITRKYKQVFGACMPNLSTIEEKGNSKRIEKLTKRHMTESNSWSTGEFLNEGRGKAVPDSETCIFTQEVDFEKTGSTSLPKPDCHRLQHSWSKRCPLFIKHSFHKNKYPWYFQRSQFTWYDNKRDENCRPTVIESSFLKDVLLSNLRI